MKRNKCIDAAILVVALMVTMLSFSACQKKEDRKDVLKVYNWGDYIDEDMLAKFPAWYKQQTGRNIRIIYQTFDINEIMLTKIERGHEDFDVVCPSEYIIERMLRKNILLPIDTCFGKTPNYIRNVSPYITKQIDATSNNGRTAHDYAVAYMWGTAGILYNKEKLTRDEARTWKSLWNSKFRKRLLMKDSYRDCYGTALIYAKRNEIKQGKTSVKKLMNDYSPENIHTVEKFLKAMKPNIEGWEADFGKETMTKGKAWLNMTWSGDAVWAIEEAEKVGVKLGYEVPLEGSNVWFDGWVIPKYAGNPKAATYFINYMCRGDVALANMETTGYVSAVASDEIFKAMTDSTLYSEKSNLEYFFGKKGKDAHLNKIMYPDSSIVARCAMIHDAGEHTPEVLDMWSKVKGDNLNGGIVLLLLCVFVAVTAFVGYRKYIRRKHRMMSRRHRRRHVIKVRQTEL